MAKGIAHREWQLHRDDYVDELGRVDERAFREAVQNELALAEHIGERLGVAIVAAPIRTRIANGAWFTVGWVFKTATVPAARDQTPRPAPAAEPSEGTSARPMVGPGGEESVVAEGDWGSFLADGWEFDDEFDDADLQPAEAT